MAQHVTSCIKLMLKFKKLVLEMLDKCSAWSSRAISVDGSDLLHKQVVESAKRQIPLQWQKGSKFQTVGKLRSFARGSSL